MAQLKTINAYLDEIKKLHRAGDSLATTILAKLLTTLDKRLTSPNISALLFSHSVSSDQLYDECSALWIAYISHYHGIAFNENDMLNNDFANIWQPFADDLSEKGLIIFTDDFFRKCLIAAEFLRRKQYGDYIINFFAEKNLSHNSAIKTLETLPTLPVLRHAAPHISDKILNFLNTNSSFNSFYLYKESENSALSAFCEFNIINGSIQHMVDQCIQLLPIRGTNRIHRPSIASYILTKQREMVGGIPLNAEQQALVDYYKPTERRAFTMSRLHNLFSDPWQAAVKPSANGYALTNEAIKYQLDLFASGITPNLKTAYNELIRHCHHLTPDQLFFVIKQLIKATEHTHPDIRDIACTLLVKLPIPLALNQEAAITLLEQLTHINIVKINGILELSNLMSFNAIKIEHFFNKLSFLKWNNTTIDVSIAIRFLLKNAFENEEKHEISHSWIEPTVCLFEKLTEGKSTSSIGLDDQSIEDMVNFLYGFCAQVAGSDRAHAAIIRLLERFVPNEMKEEVMAFITRIEYFTECLSSSFLYVDLLDKFLPATYDNRHNIIQSMLQKKYNPVKIEDKIDMLLALTRKLTLEEQIRMTTLFSDQCGVSAILINDLIYDRHQSEQRATTVMKAMEDALNVDMIREIKHLAHRT